MMNSFDITATIVVYKENPEILTKAINSFLNIPLNTKLYIIDNSPTNVLRSYIDCNKVEYIFNPSNPGFGTSHNYILSKTNNISTFHLILNPDIYFDSNIIVDLINYMDSNKNIGVLMPNILYPNNTPQYLAKLLPTPFDFLIRRIWPLRFIFKKNVHNFELQKFNYSQIIDVPFLSGCFLLFKTNIFFDLDGFDENIFMYTEDIDICRRVNELGYRSVFFPYKSVYHDHIRKKIFNKKNLIIFLKSTIYYFNKWGWFFDEKRVLINKKTLNQVIEK